MPKLIKHKLKITQKQEVVFPIENMLLCIRTIDGSPFLFAFTNENKTKEKIKIVTIETDSEIKDPHRHEYIGTYQIEDGVKEFHVFKYFGK